MIISRTPFRVSFFGGGTDYPGWYLKHGGAVLATAIDKYCYLSCRYLPPFFEHRIRIVYSRIENCQTLDDVAHPVVRAALRELRIERGVEIHHDGDLPARSGMGSSSSFTVGLLHALHALKGEMRSRDDLARESIRFEQDIVRETVGCQDQILAAFGGFNHVTFLPGGGFSVRPVTVGRERLAELQSHLMLFYTGVVRTASQVADTYVHDLDEHKRRQLRLVRDMVEEAIDIVQGGADLRSFGQLLHESWLAKRTLSASVSTTDIDAAYDAARAAGALGGKLTGAGGGGFLLLFAPPSRREDVRRALGGLLHVPFRFQFSGSQIIFFDPETEYAEEHGARRALPSASVA